MFLSGKIMRILRNGLWHRTSVDSLAAIFETGAIVPNDGRFPVTYSQSNDSYGRKIGAVSLFDFASASLAYIEEFEPVWGKFLYDQQPSILIEISRKVIADRLVPNRAKWEECGTQYAYIPRVEAWCKGEIPIVAFKRYLVIGTTLPKGFVILRHRRGVIDEIRSLAIKLNATELTGKDGGPILLEQIAAAAMAEIEADRDGVTLHSKVTDSGDDGKPRNVRC